jgi:hypothetical protein
MWDVGMWECGNVRMGEGEKGRRGEWENLKIENEKN